MFTSSGRSFGYTPISQERVLRHSGRIVVSHVDMHYSAFVEDSNRLPFSVVRFIMIPFPSLSAPPCTLFLLGSATPHILDLPPGVTSRRSAPSRNNSHPPLITVRRTSRGGVSESARYHPSFTASRRISLGRRASFFSKWCRQIQVETMRTCLLAGRYGSADGGYGEMTAAGMVVQQGGGGANYNGRR